MGTMPPESASLEKVAWQKLAEDLRTETSAISIATLLDAFVMGMGNPWTAERRALVFLQAGGLPSLIHHLRGTATSAPDVMSRITSNKAAEALNMLLRLEGAPWAELCSAKNIIPQLIEALHAAPTVVGRTTAAAMLLMFAHEHPTECKAMVEAGVVASVLLLFNDIWKWNPEVFHMLLARGKAWDGVALVHVLVCSERAAANDLRRAIRAPSTLQAFNALLIVQDCLKCGPGQKFLAAIVDSGIVDLIVAMLKHESPFCIAAAAGALGWVGTKDGGQAALEASGAIPALVRVIKRQIPPCSLEGEMAVFRRAENNIMVEGQSGLQYNDPSAMAVLSLCVAFPDSGPLLASFLEAGGVNALVQMLKRRSSCPLASGCTVTLITWLISDDDSVQTPRRQVADKFFESGLCRAAVKVLKGQSMPVRIKVVVLLHDLLKALPADKRQAAATVLVAADVVELAVEVLDQAGPNLSTCLVSLLGQFTGDPHGREKLSSKGVVEQLIPQAAGWLMQGEWPMLLEISQLLSGLLGNCSAYIPAALEGNLMPGLVRTLWALRPDGQATGGGPVNASAIQFPIDCIQKLSHQFKLGKNGGTICPQKVGNSTEFWKPAIEAGIVPVLSDMLTISEHEPTVVRLLRVSTEVLLAAPIGRPQQWAGALPRAIAGLLTANPPVATCVATEVLLNVGLVRRDLIMDFHSWGVHDSLQQLKVHSDLQTAAAASGLLHVVDCLLDPSTHGQKDIKISCEEAPSSGDLLWNCETSIIPASLNPANSPQSAGPSQSKPDVGNSAANASVNASVQQETGGHHTMRAANPNLDQALGGPDPTLRGRASNIGAGRSAKGEVRACELCSSTTADMSGKGKLLVCSGCKSVRYCGKACQKADWPSHKATCKRLQNA